MKLLFDFLPIVLFFISYKLYGVFVATGVAIAASALQVALAWFIKRKIEKMQWATLALIVVLGGATIFFQNEMFIKWKPTLINWLFALAFLVSNYIGKKPLLQNMMEGNIQLPAYIWARLNYSWIAFFGLMGVVNLFVVYQYSTDVWVNFKLFGMLGLTIVFVILQAIYLTKHVDQPATNTGESLTSED